jgi:hypothetical protein
LTQGCRELALEKLEEFFLCRSDLGENDVIEPGLDIPADSVKVARSLRTTRNGVRNGLRRGVLARRSKAFGIGQLGHHRSMLQDNAAVVTGAARGIGRAIAVEMAANGADVVAIDIAGPVSSASNAVPATQEELDEGVRLIRSFGRRSEGIKADIRNIGTLREFAERIERTYGKIDIVVATPRFSGGSLCWRWMMLIGVT